VSIVLEIEVLSRAAGLSGETPPSVFVVLRLVALAGG
jgi:hypothetical protein